MNIEKKVISILGCGRSGTSFLIKVLAANGVAVGRCTGGTLENLDVRAINDAFLAYHFHAVKNSGMPYGILPPGEIEVDDNTRRNAIHVIDELKHNSVSHCAFKDPRTTVLHHAWIDWVDYVIGVYRNPYEVADSYMKLLESYYGNDPKNEEGYKNMLSYWKRFNQSLIHVFETTDKPKFMIDFNGNVNEQIYKLFEFLDLTKINNSNDFDPNQKHQNVGPDLVLSDDLEQTYKKLKNIKNDTSI